MSSNKQPVKINTYPVPAGGRLLWGPIISGAVMYWSARPGLIEPGSWLYETALAQNPAAYNAAWWVQKSLFYFLFGAHAIETVAFAVGPLRKHGVPMFSGAWFQWVVGCFVGGVFTTKHFEQVVKAKERGRK
ncbi:hypothetical protein PG996_007823 [Apiospora saccharicola]|uniref:Uncharacterized protein n=1 Tax=Apiospora saccharicola TaxID=335842 RepID=A0ABR1UYP0_9PEZI